MNYKNYFSFLLLVGASLLFGARAAQACQCLLEPRTVLDAFNDVDVVMIASVASVKNAQGDVGRRASKDSSTTIVAEEVFKGGVKVGEEMSFRHGSPGECVWAFDERMIGQRYLLYLRSPRENSKIWSVGAGGRSNSIDAATEDLLYLKRLDELRDKTRISGRLEFVGAGDMSVAGRVVRITGASGVHEVKTNEKGVYEIYDLPAGTYLIQADTPPGWKVGGYFPRSYRSNFDGRGEDESPKIFQITLKEKTHVSFDISFVR